MQVILGSRSQDQRYLIFSSLAGFFLVAFYYLVLHGVKLTEPVAFIVTFALFYVLFDVRHFFPTYARTLFDKDFMKKNKSWFLSSWLFILFLPLIAFMLLSQGPFRSYNSFIVLTFISRLTYILGFYHLIKQNWGFMAIYKKKYGEPEDGSDRWEKLLLLSGSFLPFVYLSKISPIWSLSDQYAFHPGIAQMNYVIDLWLKIGNGTFVLGLIFLMIGFVFRSKAQYKYVSRNIGFLFVSIFMLIRWIVADGPEMAINSILLVLLLIFMISAFFAIRRSIQLKIKNPQKWMILISSLILYNGIILLPIENKFVIIMAITLPHDIQYLAFTRSFGSRYYSQSKNEHGFAKTLATKAGIFFFASIIYAFIFELGRTGIRYLPSTSDDFDYYRNVVAVFFIGMVLHHYYLDAVIWRVRKDKEISDNL